MISLDQLTENSPRCSTLTFLRQAFPVIERINIKTVVDSRVHAAGDAFNEMCFDHDALHAHTGNSDSISKTGVRLSCYVQVFMCIATGRTERL
jgi:hypothetical protein